MNGGTTPGREEAEAPPAREAHTRTDSYDTFRVYLREVGKLPLLTREQEISLARRVQAGDAEARELMIRSNLRLVVKIAHDLGDCGLPLLDLIEEGNMGLMKAVERYDPERGVKFSTYAQFWIKQSMRRGLSNQARIIRMPVYLLQKLWDVQRVAQTLWRELDREPSEEELAAASGVAEHKLRRWRESQQSIVSLDAPRFEDSESDSSLQDSLADATAELPVDSLATKEGREQLEDLLEGLSERELKVIRERFGLEGGECRTLADVGVDLGVSRERVRQIESEALKKMRLRRSKIDSGRMVANLRA